MRTLKGSKPKRPLKHWQPPGRVHAADRDFATESGDTALMSAAYFGNVEVVRVLVETGADKDLVNKDGRTALMIAISGGHFEVARLLEEAGAHKDVV